MSSIDVQHSCNEVSTIVKWKIENSATQFLKEKETNLSSPTFYLYKSRLSFHLYFKPSNPSNNDHCSLYLFPENLDNEKNVELKWKSWIENEDGDKIGDQEEVDKKLRGKNPCLVNYGFVKRSDLDPPESDFIKNNIVFICVEIIRNTSQPHFKSIPLNETEILKSYYKPNKNASKNKREKEKLTIQMKNKTFKVKKALLALRSSVFEQMLENENFDETQKSSIQIDDFEPEVMEAFIEYMHLEYITEENTKHAHELLKLADKYNVIKLKEECTQILSKTLNKDNVFSLLVTCFMYDCPDLKEAVLTYVTNVDSDSNFKNILKTKEWKEFALENERVSDEIVDAFFTKMQWLKTNKNEAGPSTSNSSASNS